MRKITFLIVVCTSISIYKPVSGKIKENKVRKVHDMALTVDTHCDTPMNMAEGNFDIGKKNTPPQSRVDFPRMKEGGLDAMFFAAFTGQKERTAENTEEAYRIANKMIDVVEVACKKYPEMAALAKNSGDAAQLEKQGLLAAYIGMENGFPIGTDIKRVKEFYDRGVRYITLCHSYNNDICDSSSDKKGAEHSGLSNFGKEVVKEMNRLGMIIDVSHISDKSFSDVIALSKAPVIASHSSVRSIAHHHRNLSDEMIKALAAKGGVIQICLLDDYVKDPDTTSVYYKKRQELNRIYDTKQSTMTEDEKKALRAEWRSLREKYPKKLPNVADYVDHIDYVKKLVGIDYVGIGSDFDGGGGLEDCVDVSQFPNITSEMAKRGYTKEEIYKVWGGNFFRVFENVEKQAEKEK